MRDLVLSTKYKKDIKALSKTPRFKKYSALLITYLACLQRGEKLPPETKNHPLAKHSPKEYKDCWDFHVVPDVCVIYRMTDDAVELVRIGQHNNLGLTENFE
jgi:YafQ family addiction module toxin component